MREQHLIVVMAKLKSFDQAADDCRFACFTSPVSQIEFVDDCGQPDECRMVDPEARALALNRAAVDMMAQVHAKHVEGNRISRLGLTFGRKLDARLGIDKPSNQPR